MLKNPGRPDRKYFAGMPIPAGAAFIASIVFFADSEPIISFYMSLLWLLAIGAVGLLMVSTWRYPSFKQANITKPRSPLAVIVFGVFIYLTWNWPQIVLLVLSVGYVSTGVFIRIGGVFRRWLRRRSRTAHPERQIG